MKLHYGNLIEMLKSGEIDVLIHGCNNFHTMGAGIAKHIRNEFPQAYEADKKTAYGDIKKLGTFSEAIVEINNKNRVVINAYTQHNFGGGVDNFSYETFPKLLKDIKEKYGDKKIGLPLIGCGLAGGDEQKILTMIKKHFDGVDYKLVEIDKNRKLKYKDEEKEIINFTSVKKPYGWMGNMAPYPVDYEGITYKTTEALFQALRFKNNPEIQQEIREQSSPMTAKIVAKSYVEILNKNNYEMMGEQDVQNMRLCIKLKLEQHPHLQEELINTNNAMIVEDCTNRPEGSGLFWGAAFQNNQWVGKNLVGNIFMEFREELKKNKNMNLEKNDNQEYEFFFSLTSPFSNFHPSLFTYLDYKFLSNEHFFMFSKAKFFKDDETAEKILKIYNQFRVSPGIFKDENQKNCYQLASNFLNGKINRQYILKNKENIDTWNTINKKIKALGREVKNYDDNLWSAKREKNMIFGARLKFNQNDDLKQILLDTKNKMLIEASKYDSTWGIGLDAFSAKNTPPEKWPGKNLLGKTLDKLKEEIVLEENSKNDVKKKVII